LSAEEQRGLCVGQRLSARFGGNLQPPARSVTLASASERSKSQATAATHAGGLEPDRARG